MQVRRAREVMKDNRLLWPAVAIAYVGAVVAILSAFSDVARSEFVYPLTLIEVITAGVVFVRSVLNPNFRQGFSRFASQIKTFRRATPWRRQFLDPDWGCWAPRYGPPSLRFLQLLAWSEVLVSFFAARAGIGDVVFLVMATFLVANGVVMLYLGLTTEPT